jgi:HK97 family phage major capsid protein
MSRTATPTPTTDVADLIIPDSPAALEEFMVDPKNMAVCFNTPGKFDEFVGKYATVVLGKKLEISQQVEEQVGITLTKFLKDSAEEGLAPRPISLDFSNPVQGLTSPDARVNARSALYNPRAMGAVLDKEFTGSEACAEYFATVWRHHKRSLDTQGQSRMTRIRNAFQSDVPSDGGFLIPEQLRSDLLRVGLETAVVRPRARVIPMETLRVPFPMIDSTSNTSSVYGGIVCYWTEEGATLTDSSPSFGRIVLDAKKLTGYTQIPQELIADSLVSFQLFISQIYPEALSFFEDIAFLKGTGVGEPVGALGATNNAIVTVAKESGQTAGSIVWENVVKMYSRMLPSSLDRAVWIVSPDTFSELATMALSVGTGGSAIWLSNGVQGPPMTILGRPVIQSEKAPGALGTIGDINFVDFGFYLVGDRQVMSASVSEHYRFANDEFAFKIVERVDGRPWLQSAITPQNNSATLSPFVNLATRA